MKIPLRIQADSIELHWQVVGTAVLFSGLSLYYKFRPNKIETDQEFSSTGGILLPGVLQAPNFQIDVRVKTGKEVMGVLFCDGKLIKVKREANLSASFWSRGLLGEYSSASHRPDIRKLKEIASGVRPGKPVTLVPVGKLYRAIFSFDCGPSLDKFDLVYHPSQQTLTVNSDCVATAWDGDNYLASGKSNGEILKLPDYQARCNILKPLRKQCWEMLENKRYLELRPYSAVLKACVEELRPPQEATAHHQAYVALLWEVTSVVTVRSLGEEEPAKLESIRKMRVALEALES